MPTAGRGSRNNLTWKAGAGTALSEIKGPALWATGGLRQTNTRDGSVDYERLQGFSNRTVHGSKRNESEPIPNGNPEC
jgi:hypothetical protein